MNWPKITKNTPLEEIKRTHQQIWQYVVENGEKPNTPYLHHCVLCEYASIIRGESKKGICNYCPVDVYNASCCLNGLFRKWAFGTDEIKELYAKAIRDVPFKYDLEKE